LVQHPVVEAQPRPPLGVLGPELDEPALGVGDAKVEEESREKQPFRPVDGRSPWSLRFSLLEDMAEFLFEDLDQIFQQDDLSFHLPTVYIPRQAVKELLIRL
jgi:hypothetical protein